MRSSLRSRPVTMSLASSESKLPPMTSPWPKPPSRRMPGPLGGVHTLKVPGAGTVICNDLNAASDVYKINPDSGLLRNALAGGQVWNAYYTLTTTSGGGQGSIVIMLGASVGGNDVDWPRYEIPPLDDALEVDERRGCLHRAPEAHIVSVPRVVATVAS